MKRRHGFTLVEVLVAIAVLSVLSVMAWRAIDGLSRTERLTRERGDELLALQAGLGQWAADLEAMTETGLVPAVDFDGRTLRLTRRDALDTPNASPGLQVVAWTLRDGQWQRWLQNGVRTRGGLTQAWEAASRWGQRPSQDDLPRQVSVARASGWQIYYHRGDSWTHPLSSTGAPSTGMPNPSSNSSVGTPPEGVRLVLTLAGPQALTGDIVRDWARPTLGGGKS
ncbi:PulJ/GspJ family protein [Hydrogenophaga soli]|nr:prepilin-type N-terminal cleavage/methylation domain-containing protein [Burkholderiaceae bacterium]